MWQTSSWRLRCWECGNGGSCEIDTRVLQFPSAIVTIQNIPKHADLYDGSIKQHEHCTAI